MLIGPFFVHPLVSCGRRRSLVAAVIACLAASAVISLAGCGEKRVSDRDLVQMSADDAAALGDGRAGVLGIGASKARWIDPRSPQKFRESRIPGAINLSLEDVRPDHPQLRGYDVLLVYGDDYNEPIAIAMCKRLLANGYKDVRTVQGGLRGWQRAGHPVESGQ